MSRGLKFNREEIAMKLSSKTVVTAIAQSGDFVRYLDTCGTQYVMGVVVNAQVVEEAKGTTRLKDAQERGLIWAVWGTDLGARTLNNNTPPCVTWMACNDPDNPVEVFDPDTKKWHTPDGVSYL